MMKLSEYLEIRRGITCIIGSGGKTTLIGALARELRQRGTVLITTTTHIYPAEGVTCITRPEEVRAAVEREGVVCAGTPCMDGKLAGLPIGTLELEKLADFVLVEADGSKGLPLKAHLPHEPVLLPNAQQVICVAGLSGLGEPISQCAHRPDRFAQLCGCQVTDIATPQRLAAVLNREHFHHRVLLNQAHSVEEYQLAAQVAQQLSCSVFGGSLQEGVIVCLS